MDTQKCPNCAGPMVLYQHQTESDFFKCKYCGSVLNIPTIKEPQSTLDKLFSFANQFISNDDKNVEKEKLMNIINDPTSTKEAIRYAKKELKRLNNERSGRY